MSRLILIRHSIAESGSFETSDFERKLTPQGVKRAYNQSEELKNKNIKPDLIISSSATRAIETAGIFSEQIGERCPVKEVPFLYENYTTNEFFSFLNTIDNKYSTVLLVGHNPTISEMAYRLDSDVSVAFSPCEIVIVSVGNNWNLLEVGGGKIDEVISPKG